MLCPFCQNEETEVVNTRSTFHQTQVWRRRRCQKCNGVFTTYEKADLSFIKIIKKSGRKERYSRAKLFAGIYGAFLSGHNKERTADEVTTHIESKILGLRKKEISSQEVGNIVLTKLKSANPPAFMRFLAYNTRPANISEIKKNIEEL